MSKSKGDVVDRPAWRDVIAHVATCWSGWRIRDYKRVEDARTGVITVSCRKCGRVVMTGRKSDES